MPAMKPNDILAAIVREVRKDVDPVPPGYLSLKEIQKAWKLPRATCQGHILIGMQKGLMHRIKLRQIGPSGIKVYTYFYKEGPAPKCRTPKR